MEIRNLTPHVINVNGKAIPPDGVVARVAVNRAKDIIIDGIQFHVPAFGEPTDVPPYKKGTILVVSAMVRSHPSLKDRIDICSPGAPVRDADGKIVGCDGLDANGSMSWLRD